MEGGKSSGIVETHGRRLEEIISSKFDYALLLCWKCFGNYSRPVTRFHLEMNKTSKLCINKTISIVNFILLSFLYSNRRIGCKIPGRVTKVSKYIMMVNFKQYTYIRPIESMGSIIHVSTAVCRRST